MAFKQLMTSAAEIVVPGSQSVSCANRIIKLLPCSPLKSGGDSKISAQATFKSPCCCYTIQGLVDSWSSLSPAERSHALVKLSAKRADSKFITSRRALRQLSSSDVEAGPSELSAMCGHRNQGFELLEGTMIIKKMNGFHRS